MQKDVLAKYINGNYVVTIYTDGTKIRSGIEEFKPRRPESIDMTISTHCTNGCPYCYLDASPQGAHVDLEFLKNLRIPKYTEVAINWSNQAPMLQILNALSIKKSIVNITINQRDLFKLIKNKSTSEDVYSIDFEYFKFLQRYAFFNGLGVSLTDESISDNEVFKSGIDQLNNVVLHAIAGITPIEHLKRYFSQGRNLLILGFKSKGKGKSINVDLTEYINELSYIVTKFKTVCFDELGLEQLDVKNTLNLSEDIWKHIYLGEDGTTSFYIDAVNKTFFKSSVSTAKYDIFSNNVNDLFKKITSGEII